MGSGCSSVVTVLETSGYRPIFVRILSGLSGYVVLHWKWTPWIYYCLPKRHVQLLIRIIQLFTENILTAACWRRKYLDLSKLAQPGAGKFFPWMSFGARYTWIPPWPKIDTKKKFCVKTKN